MVQEVLTKDVGALRAVKPEAPMKGGEKRDKKRKRELFLPLLENKSAFWAACCGSFHGLVVEWQTQRT